MDMAELYIDNHSSDPTMNETTYNLGQGNIITEITFNLVSREGAITSTGKMGRSVLVLTKNFSLPTPPPPPEPPPPEPPPPEPPPPEPPPPEITNLRIVVRYIGYLQRGFRLNNTDSWYPGTTSAWGTTYGTSNVSWSPSRPGGGSWTWADVSNLQVIVGLQTGKITQVYVIVESTGGNQILRPNGKGYYNEIVNPPSSPPEHWALVDDEVPDDDATYVWTGSTNYEKDSYELTDPM